MTPFAVDPVLQVRLVPFVLDALILASVVLALALGTIPARWRMVTIGFMVVIAAHMAGMVAEALGGWESDILPPAIESLVILGLIVMALLTWREILRPQRILNRAERKGTELEGNVDEAPALVIGLTRDGVVRHINRYGAHFLRDMAGSFTGRDFFTSCVPEAYRAEAREGFYRFVGSSGQSGNVVEFPVRTLDGERIVSCRLSGQYDDAGDVVGAILYGEDVTARREARVILERYHALQERASDVIMFVRVSDGRIIEANSSAERTYGYPRERLLTLTMADLRDPATHSMLARDMAQAVERGVRFETRHRRSNGETFPVEVSSGLIDNDGEQVLASIVRDVSERHRAAVEIENHRRRLAELARELTVTEERQRKLLATDLHDRVSQPLAAAKLKLEVALHRRGVDDVSEFSESVGLLGEAISETRAITREMSPPLLYDVGLGAALEWLAGCTSLHGLECEVACDATESLDHDARAFLFRTARELLMNVSKHSGTDRAALCLSDNGDSVLLAVSDDGNGFDPSVLDRLPDDHHGFGLFSIAEQATALGATIRIDSADGAGTLVEVSVPMPDTPGI